MGLNNFRNAWAMRVLLSTEHHKFNVDSKNGKKMLQNIYSSSDNLISIVSSNSDYYFGNTGSSQSTCHQTDLKS